MNNQDFVFEGKFIWNILKNEENKRKHGVSFEEATTAFDDNQVVCFPDEEHSQVEERFIILGLSDRPRLLFVCHCYKENDLTRIISAREATKRERSFYNEYNR